MWLFLFSRVGPAWINTLWNCTWITLKTWNGCMMNVFSRQLEMYSSLILAIFVTSPWAEWIQLPWIEKFSIRVAYSMSMSTKCILHINLLYVSRIHKSSAEHASAEQQNCGVLPNLCSSLRGILSEFNEIFKNGILIQFSMLPLSSSPP